MLLYFIFIIFGILLFLIFNHINNFSIGGLNYRLYEYENDYHIINVDGGGGIGSDWRLVQTGVIDTDTFDTINAELQLNPTNDPRVTDTELRPNDYGTYTRDRPRYFDRLKTYKLNDDIINKILDAYYGDEYQESLLKYNKIKLKLCAAKLDFAIPDHDSYDLDILFGERGYHDNLLYGLQTMQTDLFQQILTQNYREHVDLQYAFNIHNLFDILDNIGGTIQTLDNDHEDITLEQLNDIFIHVSIPLLADDHNAQKIIDFIDYTDFDIIFDGYDPNSDNVEYLLDMFYSALSEFGS